MDIIIIGYGKMGRLVEVQALQRGHRISRIIDHEDDWGKGPLQGSGDIAIEFSQPDTAIHNFNRCIDAGIAVVTGTTGWHDQLETMKKKVLDERASFLYASNFNIGVNIFFELNRKMAELSNSYQDYLPSITETHHTAKKDKPSGTAVTLAGDILRQRSDLDSWVCDSEARSGDLKITSVRKGEVRGIHEVNYQGPWDEITLRHNARDRTGFAFGALLAAEWLKGKHGFFEFRDIITSIIDKPAT